MICKFKSFYVLFFALALALVPVMTLAAHDTVTHSSSVTINLPQRNLNFTLDSESELESYTINDDDINFVVSHDSVFKLSYSGKMKFVASSNSCVQTNVECDTGNNSYIRLNCTNEFDGTQTINVTALLCGGGSDGGGGGGGSTPPPVADTSAPSGTSIVINSSATSTASVNVTLALSATDSSTPMQMMISNDSAFTEASWETYATTKSWTLATGAGTKTVYAKFKDSAGNTSSAVSDTITLLGTETVVPTVPATTPPPAPVATTELPLAPAPVAQVPAQQEVPEVVLANPESKIEIYDVAKYSYQPNESLKFNYKYKNEGAKTVKVKIVRQLLNSKGKVVKTSTATKSIKAGKEFAGAVNEKISKSLKPGEYTERVRVLNTKNKILDENSFKINVEKLKVKYFALGELPGDTDIAFNSAVFGKIKSNVKLPVSIKLKYSYTNSTDQKHTVKMVRELVDENGKVAQTKTGKWSMKVGESYSQSFTQSLPSTLSAGNYSIKIKAYDWTTKELLAENSVGFAVELK